MQGLSSSQERPFARSVSLPFRILTFLCPFAEAQMIFSLSFCQSSDGSNRMPSLDCRQLPTIHLSLFFLFLLLPSIAFGLLDWALPLVFQLQTCWIQDPLHSTWTGHSWGFEQDTQSSMFWVSGKYSRRRLARNSGTTVYTYTFKTSAEVQRIVVLSSFADAACLPAATLLSERRGI